MKTKPSSDEVQYYDWRLSRWLTSETRERLDAAGRGIYRELIDHCYAQGDFPDDAEWISRKCACSVREFSKWWPIIERHFPKTSRSGYRHNTISSLWRKQYFSLCKTNRKNGKAGGYKRRESKDMPSDRLPTAKQPPEQPPDPSLSDGLANRIEQNTTEENTNKKNTTTITTLPVLHSDFPLTAIEIHKHDPAVDDFFIRRIANAVAQQLLSDAKVTPERAEKAVTDEILAHAVSESYRTFTGRGVHGSGLLLSRVPRILQTWCKED